MTCEFAGFWRGWLVAGEVGGGLGVEGARAKARRVLSPLLVGLKPHPSTEGPGILPTLPPKGQEFFPPSHLRAGILSNLPPKGRIIPPIEWM